MKVLMIGPARTVKGGMTSVVNNYFENGLDKIIDLKYIETINDKCKILKLFKEIKGKIEFLNNIKKYDIVHIHMASRRSAMRKCKYINISKCNNKKVVLHMHGGGFKKFLEEECSPTIKEYVINTLRKCEKIIVLSEEWYDYFSKYIEKDRLLIMYNSVYVPSNINKELDMKSFLFLGRINKNKGIYDLIEVFTELLKDNPELKLNIGGSGEEDKIKKLIKFYNIEKNVSLLGWITKDIKEQELINNSYFILPSYVEAMPVSILEAMAYKNVTISTNVGGIPKIINNMENGVLIEAGNKEELKRNMEILINDKNLCQKISEEAYQTIKEKFNIEKSINRLVNIYKSLVEE